MASFMLQFFYSQLFVTPALPDSSFKDQTIVVTGANRGLGLEAARHFVHLGASKVIMGVRSVSKGEEAKADIERSEKCDRSIIEVWSLDMLSSNSVKDFASRLSTLPRLDVVVASAGINKTQGSKHELVEGHESSVLTNVINTFLLTFLALPIMKKTAQKFNTRPHFVIISSEVHYFGTLAAKDQPSIFAALDADTTLAYRYQDTKLLEILVVRELFNSVIKSPESFPVIINTVNPGWCRTDFVDDAGPVLHAIMRLIGRTAEKGSRTYVHAAATGDEAQGQYLSDCGIGSVSSFVQSDEGKKTGKRVWDELKVILEEIQPGVTNLD